MIDVPASNTLAEALSQIVGYELSSVTFVRDYVQFAFEGSGSATLTAYTHPSINLGTERSTWAQFGYRDALCRQIGCAVEHTEVAKQEVIVVFKGGAAISISLREQDYRGPEALLLSLGESRMWVA